MTECGALQHSNLDKKQSGHFQNNCIICIQHPWVGMEIPATTLRSSNRQLLIGRAPFLFTLLSVDLHEMQSVKQPVYANINTAKKQMVSPKDHPVTKRTWMQAQIKSHSNCLHQSRVPTMEIQDKQVFALQFIMT